MKNKILEEYKQELKQKTHQEQSRKWGMILSTTLNCWKPRGKTNMSFHNI